VTVFATIAAWISERKLGARQHHGLAETGQQKAERGGRVREGVGAMYDDEAVELRVTRGDDARDPDPVVGPHVRRVEQWLEHSKRMRGHVEPREFRHRIEIGR
jgi:hypothetical protein